MKVPALTESSNQIVRFSHALEDYELVYNFLGEGIPLQTCTSKSMFHYKLAVPQKSCGPFQYYEDSSTNIHSSFSAEFLLVLSSS